MRIYTKYLIKKNKKNKNKLSIYNDDIISNAESSDFSFKT